uniref:Exo-beta-D-glucosaminidase n=1 Tax=Talaromyces marneffei PM1 TaxID=1077442 RepID=A0A093URA4_TALMA
MRCIALIVATIGAILAVGHAASPPSAIVYSAGNTAKIPGWNLQSVLHAPSNLAELSQPGANVANWSRVSSRATVMAGLIETGVYSDSNLWFSDNLNKIVDRSVFGAPWLYREEFTVNPSVEEHYFLITHGITSKADIWLNGRKLADKEFQQGSYGGHKYEVSDFLQPGVNAILIQAYETSYLLDSAMGFVDWNPYPPDNGTGVWRDVEISQTGPVSLAPIRFIHDWTPGKTSTRITIRVNATNLESRTIDGTLAGKITLGSQQLALTQPFTLAAHEEKTVSMTGQIRDPQIWWPWLWGDQPLYNITVMALVNNELSDIAEPRRVGIRYIQSGLNSHGDQYVKKKFELMIDMGMNTVRLEGKQEHPELFDLADEMGLMIMSGWECCDWWEGWTYNEDVPDYVRFTDHDYLIANYSMLHEASMMQTHPSILAFLVGSDYWPDDRAASIYVNALKSWDWPNPVIASAGELGFPDILGSSGMKMDGPYDYVPPNYWYGDQVGAAFGFGSEEGPGVGTPEIRSLKNFLSDVDLNDLWTQPTKGLFHMSSDVSSFYDRSVYNNALWNRYGSPKSLDDYLLKAQMMDYEATRAEFEGFTSLQDASRPSTGVAWPNLHWQLFDYYLNPAGSYFGSKVGARPEHISFSYDNGTVYIINRFNFLGKGESASRWVAIDLIDTAGRSLYHQTLKVNTMPNHSQQIANIAHAISKIKDVAFLRLILSSDPKSDKNLSGANVVTTVKRDSSAESTTTLWVHLENKSDVTAFFIRLVLIDSETDKSIDPPFWSDNYVTLFPHESLDLTVSFKSLLSASPAIEVSGGNLAKQVMGV